MFGTRTSRACRILGWSVLAVTGFYLLLLIPDLETAVPAAVPENAFAWNQNEFWSSLEAQFKEARSLGCERLASQIDSAFSNSQQLLDTIAASRVGPEDQNFHLLETNLFRLAPLIGACVQRLPEYVQLATQMREVVKDQSQHWNLNSPEARHQIYRLLYGGRAALEEVMLQAPRETMPGLVAGHHEPSRTPATKVLGVTIHSGDILVSRGGAPTSALIARGNDYPGNFSHVALVHVDAITHRVSVIEAHIEQGAAIASLQDYLADKKLRVMVLRPRADLPQLIANPMLPHQAASDALTKAKSHHIPYDFEMDYRDHRKLFCSEVASAAYEKIGIKLWLGISHISAPGVISWLSAFGVRHFETQEPSDLEYDPQLRVVAEWRNSETLFKDHADNAVIDVMLEGADLGEKLGYSWYMLPLGRLAKFYSVIKNFLGYAGPVQEGMSATAALRNKQFARTHGAIKARLVALAAEFKTQRGYVAPYWELVRLARQAKKEIEDAL